MKIGFVGLGRLGLPMALGFALRGHEVIGYDKNPDRMQKEWFCEMENGVDGISFESLLAKCDKIRFEPLHRVVIESEIIFLVIDTNCETGYDGTVPMPEERRGYNLDNLEAAIRDLNSVALHSILLGERTVVLVSTVLPGTTRDVIRPMLDTRYSLVTNPQFCAMGTVLNDLYFPEHIILGGGASSRLAGLYQTITFMRPQFVTWTESEIIKTMYNAFITMKVNYANTVMEICHRVGNSDCGIVSNVLKQATHRLTSPAYLNGGMGDAGPCHPKENMALSYLAKEIDLSYDFFEANMQCRQNQTAWLAGLLIQNADRLGVQAVWILGTAFKPGVNIEDGSSALLLMSLINETRPDLATVVWDPVIGSGERPDSGGAPIAGIISCKHESFKEQVWPTGSIIIDPHRYLPSQDGVEVVQIGSGRS